MKKMFKAMSLLVLGSLCAGGILAPATIVAQATAAPAPGGTIYVIYKNGQAVGRCVVQNAGELQSVADQLGQGTYVFVGTGDGTASADRRIIVYTTTSVAGGAASVSADRRIIVYQSLTGGGAPSATADRRIILY